MSMHTSTDLDVDEFVDEYEDTCANSESIWGVLLAAGSALMLGYLVGRVSYSHDLDEAIRQIEESSEPLTVTIPTL